jgi:serine/threonine-protein kinase
VGALVGGRYQLRREVGRSPFTVVYEAVHSLTRRVVALKVTAGDLPPPRAAEYAARLEREARALGSVHHPGIVEILDGGALEDGTPFLVLEKLDGRTLESLLATRGGISLEDSVAVGLQLCDGLDAIHASGVVHRNVTPGNVIVVRDHRGAERLKLLGFTLAQARAPKKITGVGALIGTPNYMSPEQLLGLEVDHRTDIYSLGVTLFECLTGRLPYEGNYQAVLTQACAPDARFPKLSEALPEAGPKLSDALEQATTRQPEHRFPSAADFGRALFAAAPTPRARTFLLGTPPAPRFGPPPTPPRVPPPVQQRRKTPRAAYATLVQLAHATGILDGRSEDISEGGMLILCRGACESGGFATLRFALPIDGKVVSCRGHIRWVRAAHPEQPQGPRAIGFEFVELDASVRAAIAQYTALMGR